MKIGLIGMLATTAIFSATAIAEQHIHGQNCAHGGGFLPPNDLWMQDSLDSTAGLTEVQFNAVIDRAQAFYGPVIQAQGGHLTIQKLWSDATVNANASQAGAEWNVNMYGGLARRAEVTVDGFALVLCHELGHHLGGHFFTSAWAANEGQSDYFATQSCARELWGEERGQNANSRATVPATPKAKCNDVYQTEGDQDLCYRVMEGSKSISDLLGALGSTPVDWDHPDASVVTRTNSAHPKAQCRLDTYMAGALCTKDFDKSVIPAKALGAQRNSVAGERDSMLYTCTAAGQFTAGNRPLCWFKPQVQ